ncbi:hypothetical protein NQ176_g10058 [Zarea fungicola]|uniref:Uncharacterized protein n=1 Tax=Zarea fungicola TaxID=93591 RepID=A0ACC1MK26_9HYPO|nr:hypothetical protein NQ176_g10058 [Lecanicillium fungicola]
MASANPFQRFSTKPSNCLDLRSFGVKTVPPCFEMDKMLVDPPVQSATTVSVSSHRDSSNVSGSTSTQYLPSVGRSVSFPVKTAAVHAMGKPFTESGLGSFREQTTISRSGS